MTYGQRRTASWTRSGASIYTFFPGSINDAAGTPNEIWLASGIVHTMEFFATVGCSIRAYDYRNVNGSPIIGGTTLAKHRLTLPSGGAVIPAAAPRFNCFNFGATPAAFTADNRVYENTVGIGNFLLETEFVCPNGIAIRFNFGGAQPIELSVCYTPYTLGAQYKRQAAKVFSISGVEQSGYSYNPTGV